MTWNDFVGARVLPIALSIAVAATSVLAAPVAASAAPSAATPRIAAASAGSDAPDAEPVGPLPAMDDYAAADYERQAAALPPALAEAATRDLGLTGAEYLATTDAAADAVRVVDALEDRGVDVLGSRLDGTELTVSVESATDAAAVTAAGAVAEVGEPDTRDFSAVDFAAADLYGGSGYVWENTDGTANQCSVGFAGYQVSSGKKRLVTAGHCLAGMTDITGEVRELRQARAGDAGEFGGTIGLPIAGSGTYGGGYDTGILNPSSAHTSMPARVLTWGGGAMEPFASTPLPIVGWSAAIEGGVLCKSGSRTGWSCGTVLAVDEPVTVSGEEVNTIVTDACVQPGDSGGAVVGGPLAVGIVSGSTEVPCDDPRHLSVFFPMISSSGGPSVQARYGKTWEPAVTVPMPVATSVVTGSTAAAGSISGTLPIATEGSRVRVYIDDSPTPYATVDASTARWSVTLGPLSAGPHRLAVVAGWGSWSRSPVLYEHVQVGAMAAVGDVIRAPGGLLYLLADEGRLVPVPSAAIAAELTTRPIITRTAEEIAAFTVDASRTIGSVVACERDNTRPGDETYIASGGMLWFLGYGPTGLPVTPLDEKTCGTFDYSTEGVRARVLLRSAATGGIFLLDAGTKRRLVTMAAVNAITGYHRDYLHLSDEVLATIPDGREILTPGSLVKTASSPAVYLVDGMSRKIPITSFATAAEYGVHGFTTVAASTLDAYTTASAPLSILFSCGPQVRIAGSGQFFALPRSAAGLPVTALDIDTCTVFNGYRVISGAPFLRSPETGQVFLLRDGTKHPLRTMAAVTALAGGTVPSFVSLSRTSLDGIPTGRELLGPGTLVKTASSPVVFLVDGLNRTVPIDSFATAAEFGATGYSTVPASVLDAYRAAPASLSLAVTCRSTHYLAGGGSLWALEARSSFGLRTSALEDGTCDALRTSPQSVADALFVRNTGTGAVYHVSGGRKTYLATMGDVYARNGGVLPVFVPLSAAALKTLP
jgi:hypothetical protein